MYLRGSAEFRLLKLKVCFVLVINCSLFSIIVSVAFSSHRPEHSENLSSTSGL